MPAFTTNQWAVVILVLVAGWLLGLMSRSSGGKWRRAYDEEHERHLELRRDFEAHLQQHGMVSDTRIPPLEERTTRRPL